MDTGPEYTLKINRWSPDTIPMARLAEYMGDFARLLGNMENVHFVEVREGSAALACQIEPDAATSIAERMAGIGRGSLPRDAVTAYENINGRLVADQTDAAILGMDGVQIVRFAGAPRARDRTVASSFTQVETLDGFVQRIYRSGKEASLLLQTADGRRFHCRTYQTVARELGSHLFDAEVRLHGVGRWRRLEDGAWVIEDFFVRDFTVLQAGRLGDVIAELRAVGESDWDRIADPWQELDRLRDEIGGA